MQAAELIDRRVAGPEIKMIGIPENDRRAGPFQHFLRKCFYAALRTDRHESRRVNRAVRGRDATGSRTGDVVACDPLE